MTALQVAVLLHSLWAVSLLLFVLSDHLPVPRYCHPLLLYTLVAAFFLNPTRRYIIIIILIIIIIIMTLGSLAHESRFWVLGVLGRAVLAPCFHVEFADLWLADQLNSLSQVRAGTLGCVTRWSCVQALQDLLFMVCFYTSGDSLSSDWRHATGLGQCATVSWWWDWVRTEDMGHSVQIMCMTMICDIWSCMFMMILFPRST